MTDDQYADHLADVYLNGITSISNDAGWEGESLLSLLIAFHGQIPWGQGGDQSNMTMIHAIEKLRRHHAEFDRVRGVVVGMLRTYGEEDKIRALLARRYYVGLNEKTGRVFNDCDRIASMGYAPVVDNPEDAQAAWAKALKRYRKRIKIAREMLVERVGRKRLTQEGTEIRIMSACG